MKTDAQPLSKPCGIRVWRGFRSRDYIHSRGDFDDIVGNIFVPQTAQQMEPLGLQAYFPALLPSSLPQASDLFFKIPDEIALAVYPSKEAYQYAASSSVAGRAYGRLHSLVFNFRDPDLPQSKSMDPQPWSGKLSWDMPYSLLQDAINWRMGVTRLLVAKPIDADNCLDQFNEIISNWLSSRSENVDGSIICVCPEYLLYWEHRRDNSENKSLLPLLKDAVKEVYLCDAAKPAIVPPAFHQPDNGVNMSVGDFLDVRVDSLK